MKMEPIMSSETSAIRTQTPANCPKKEQITSRTRRKLKNKKVMKMEPIMSSETSAITTQAPANYPKKEQITFRTRWKLKNRNFQRRSTWSLDGFVITQRLGIVAVGLQRHLEKRQDCLRVLFPYIKNHKYNLWSTKTQFELKETQRYTTSVTIDTDTETISNLHSAHTLQQPSQCSHPTATFTVLTPYSNLHSAHTLQQPSQCSHPTATFAVLTPYSYLHSAHTLQQPSQCSHPTATFTVLTPYSNLHSAHTPQRSTTAPQPATSNTTSKYTPYAVTRGLFSWWWA